MDTTDEDWIDKAPCRGLPTEWFFPERGGNLKVSPGLAVCKTCPYRKPCLALGQEVAMIPSTRHGHSRKMYGIWGGMSEWRLKAAKKLAQVSQ